jgi:excisionase family DNA binding protein
VNTNEVLLIDVKQAAELLGVSRSYFYERILNRGLVAPIRLGRSVRFRPADIESLVERLASGEVAA